MPKNFPRKDLYVLFDIPRLRVRKAHDEPEELLTVRLTLGYRLRPEAFEIAADAILFFDGKSNSDKRLEKMNCVDAGDVVLPFILP